MDQSTVTPDIPVEDAPPQRRSFFKKALAVVIGAIVTIVPGAAGIATLISPLRKKGSGRNEFLKVATLDSIPADGSPRRFTVLADLSDAWTGHAGTRIGSVYLKRSGDKVIAFNTDCPHLGCSVDAKPDGSFRCPCHESSFDPNGSLKAGAVSPRGLDELEVKVDGNNVLVKYQKFVTGLHDKVPRA